MKFKQAITALMAFVLSALMLVSAASLVSASHLTPQFVLDSVEINDKNYTHDQAVLVTRGDSLEIEVFFHGIGEGTKDAKVSAELVGYEWGNVEDEKGLFEIHPGVYDSKKLVLQMPEDLRASDDYKIRVTLEDDDTAGFTEVFSVRVEEKRHFVNTFDVILNPPSHVQPGQPLFVTVRVENLGANVEDSVKVTASIPALGVQTSEFVDVLATEERVRDDDDDRHIRDASTTNDLLLMIPEDAKPGEYLLSVVLQYNRLHNRQEKVLPIVIEGQSPAAEGATPKSLVSVDQSAQRTEAGKGVVYKVSVANLEGVAKMYSVAVSGMGAWGSFRVDPLARTVAPDQTAEFNVYVNPVEGASAGTNTFTLNVQDQGGKVIAQQSVSLEVAPAIALTTGSVKRVLEVGFVVLLVILVILGIVIIAKKLAGEGEDEGREGSTRTSKKSYY